MNHAHHPPDPEIVALASRVFDHARRGDTRELTTFLDAGIPVNLTNDKGDTLLMLAAYHGHTDTVTLLLDRGADPDRLNDRGQSPLAGAVFRGETDVVRLLAARGADPDTGTPTARQTARMFDQHDLIALFDTP
ncbi:ankyrin repeat domain-containing protein [Nocardiopsis sp. FIRDI 009]|uniref:ankyrin repeat domain-containing protein n=1 Tax=Nocardiopsis sp. FIRDI 009 TaxID=714197 RepID=UPI000E2853DE|nr:ankyrin repeat domain-containing protein [Nocardiopsis sp. FIRDI 009]